MEMKIRCDSADGIIVICNLMNGVLDYCEMGSREDGTDENNK